MKKVLILSVTVNVILAIVIGILVYTVVPYKPFKNLSADKIKTCTIRIGDAEQDAGEQYVKFLLEVGGLCDLAVYRKPVRISSDDKEREFLVIELKNGKKIEVSRDAEFYEGKWYLLMNGKYYQVNGDVSLG